MKTTRKVLLAGTALAVAAIGNPALAQVGTITPGTITQGANNGDDLCIDGTTQDGYTINHAPADSVHGASDVDFDPDYTDQVACVSYEADQDFSVSNGPALTIAEVDSTGEDDLLIVEENGTGNATGNVSVEITTHLDVTDPNNPVFLGLTQTSAPYGTFNAVDYSYSSSVETLQDTLYEAETNVSGVGATGTGSQSEYLVTTGNIWFEETTGTSSFDPGTGDVFYTPTAGTTTQMDIDGLHITTLDPSGNETISFNADGISNGTSYVDVNPDSVVIHGGTTSTTVTVDNNGVLVQDSTNGTTFQVTNTGNVYVAGQIEVDGDTWLNGNLDVDGDSQFDGNVFIDGVLDVDSNAQFDANVNVSGFTTTNGIDNTGSLETDTLTVNGATTLLGFTTSNGIDNTGLLDTDTLQVDGTANFSGQVTSNGIDNVGLLETDTLDVNGAGNVDGTLTVGGAVIANGGVNTAAIWNGTQNAGAGVTVEDSLLVDGTINAGNVAGNNTIGGSAATSSTLAAGTSYVRVNTDSVLIHGGTTSTNVLVNDAGVNITSTPGGGNLTIASDGSISSGNTGLNSGAVTVNDGLVVRAGNGTAGFGGITTGTVAINTAGNNKISGLANATLSATSTEAVTGQQLFATNQALAALDAREAANFARLMDRADKAYQGVAMNFALNAAPLALDNGEGGISGGIGYFQGEWAGAVKAQYVTDAGIGVGVNLGFSEDAVGGGVGASIKF